MTDPTPPLDLAALRELAAKASPGPWSGCGRQDDGDEGLGYVYDGSDDELTIGEFDSEIDAQLASLAHRLLPLAEFALKIADEDSETAHLACPGPPNCGGFGAHYPDCPVTLATDALADLDSGVKALGLGEDAVDSDEHTGR